jgi:hypothetical protein
MSKYERLTDAQWVILSPLIPALPMAVLILCCCLSEKYNKFNQLQSGKQCKFNTAFAKGGGA